MTKAAYEKRKLQQKRTYRFVRNYTGNAKLAKKLSTWSAERIYKEYGIYVGKRLPKLKSVTKTQKKIRDEKIQAWIYSYQLGYNLKQREAIKKKRKPLDYIVDIEPEIESEPLIVDYEAPEIEFYGDEFYNGDSSKSNRKKWSEWSKKENDYPDFIKNVVEKINKEMGFDSQSSYGYAAAYYMFTENLTEAEVLKFLKPDRFSNGDIYVDSRKI